MQIYETEDAGGELDLPEGWVPVRAFSCRQAAQDAGLVILAMGQAYWMLSEQGQFILCVRKGALDVVDAELQAVEALGGRRRVGEPPVLREFSAGWLPSVLYATILTVVFMLQSEFPLVERGGVDAEAIIREQQIWRTVTALTLHGDVVHLVSNLIAGAGFGLFVSRIFGSASGWLLICLSGAMGNWLNAWVYFPDAHFSIGASTAVFAALGLLTGAGIRVALGQPGEGWTIPRWLLPIFGGLTLLGLLGVGDARVDVAAHISGFLCGTLFGFLAASVQGLFLRMERYSRPLGLIPLLLVLFAWAVALSGGV